MQCKCMQVRVDKVKLQSDLNRPYRVTNDAHTVQKVLRVWVLFDLHFE